MSEESKDKAIPEGFCLLQTLATHSGALLLFAWSPDGHWLAAVLEDGSLELWNTQTWIMERERKIEASQIVCLTWSHDAAMLAVVGNENIIVWNIGADAVFPLFAEQAPVAFRCASWSPDKQTLACGADDKTIWFLNIETRQMDRQLIGHTSAISALSWSPEENFLASGGDDGLLRLWDIRKNQEAVQIYRGHTAAISMLAWTSDSEMLASASLDRTTRLWNKVGRQEGIFEGHTDAVLSIAFLHDPIQGQLLASKSSDGNILLWQTHMRETRIAFREPYTHERSTHLAFHPQQSLLATSDGTGSNICIWSIDLPSLFQKASLTQSVLYKNAKIVILGSNGTGKSNLNLALTGAPFIPVLPLEEHHIRLLDRREMQFDDGHREIYETFLWDMDGRSGYRLIHQLYLHDVIVALIVLDTRNETNPAPGLTGWVRALRTMRRLKRHHTFPSKIFLVITRIDRGASGMSRKRLQDLAEKLGFDGIFETSAKEGQGIQELKQAILGAIAWEMLPEVSSTTLLQEIRNFLIDKKMSGQQLCTESELYEAFLQIRAKTASLQHKDPQAQFETCIGYVEAQGLIRRLSFGNYILLQPELFDIYASALLDEALNDPDGFGSLDEDKVLQGDFTVDTVPIKDKGLELILLSSIINDFLRFELAFSERTDGPEQQTRLVFPSHSTQDNPDLPDPEEKYYIFHFEGEAVRLYSTLAVRLARSGYFVKKDLWRNAITYTSAANEKCGVFLRMQDETHGELVLFFEESVSEKTRFDFASYVYWHLKSRGKLLHIQHILICNGCNSRFTEQQVKNRRERHEATIRCSVCGTVASLPTEETIFTFSASVQQIDRNADTQLKADTRAAEMKRRKEMDDYDVFFCYNDNEEDKREIKAICDELENNGILAWFEEIDLRPGSMRLKEITHQMQKVKAAVVCFGTQQENPRWQEAQMSVLLNQSFSRGCTIIPVLLKHSPTEKPELAPFFDTRWVDFHNWNPDPIDELIWGITNKRQL